jgi:hypothetical protein
VKRWRVLTFSLALLLTACGDGDTPPTVTPPPPGQPQVPPKPATVTDPRIVTVGTGTTVGGVDIVVGPPASATPPDAQVLGVVEVEEKGGMAFNTGGSVPRGAQRRVLLFGPGLSGDMRVTISGAADISISNIRSIQATDDTPGIAFDINVNSDAALGARTVILRDAKDDITTFSGGLEVVP